MLGLVVGPVVDALSIVFEEIIRRDVSRLLR
jgi:hypothetical protein